MSKQRFENKTVIITGGGSGIGRAAGARFAAEGANVVLNGRSENKLIEAAKAIDPTGQRVAIYAGDIAQPETAHAIVALAKQRYGGVDVLLNNAGIFSPKAFLDHDETDFDRFLGTILKGKFFMAQAAAKAMKERGGGAIVHTGSMWAESAVAATPSSAYSAANAGVHALVRNLAIELASENIRINGVAPAVVKTPVYNTFIPPTTSTPPCRASTAFTPSAASARRTMWWAPSPSSHPTRRHGSRAPFCPSTVA